MRAAFLVLSILLLATPEVRAANLSAKTSQLIEAFNAV